MRCGLQNLQTEEKEIERIQLETKTIQSELKNSRIHRTGMVEQNQSIPELGLFPHSSS